MHLYKESLRKCEDSYHQGKEDAYEEVLKWFLGFNSSSGGHSQFKHVPVNEFFNFISQKLQDHRTGAGGSNSSSKSHLSSRIIQGAAQRQSGAGHALSVQAYASS